MTIILVSFVGISAVWVSFVLFKKVFNPISFYTAIWAFIVLMFELKLIYFYPLSVMTWLFLAASYLAFVLGVIIHFSARGVFGNGFHVSASQEKKFDIVLFEKILKKLLVIFTVIGVIASLQMWYVLLGLFGSVPKVLMNSYKIYHMRHEGELVGVWPYVWMFAYFAVFLSGMYMAVKGKLSVWGIIALLSVIIREIARFSRQGILVGLLELFVSFILMRYFLNAKNIKVKFNRKHIMVATTLILSLVIIAAGLIRVLRNKSEDYGGTSRVLRSYSGGLIISPQVYFYFASQIGVFNKFLEEDKERYPVGSSTFMPVYKFLAKVGLVDKIDTQHKGYMIPNWSNTGTYLRDVYNDFGVSGIVLIPFLLGLLLTHYWQKFFKYGKFKDLVILHHLFVIVGISFFIFATRMLVVSLGGFFLYFLMKSIDARVRIQLKMAGDN
jgi:oligosaccharide repeat unit polymerase